MESYCIVGVQERSNIRRCRITKRSRPRSAGMRVLVRIQISNSTTPLFSPLLCHCCLYGQVGYHLKAGTYIGDSNNGHKLGSFTTQCDLALIQSGEQELRSNQTSASHALNLSGLKRAHYFNVISDGMPAKIVKHCCHSDYCNTSSSVLHVVSITRNSFLVICSVKTLNLTEIPEEALNDLIRTSLGPHGKVDWNLH